MLENYKSAKYKVLLILCCFLSIGVTSQITTTPNFINADDTVLPQLCFNTDTFIHTVLFTTIDTSLTGALLVQLSDADGDFTSPIVEKHVTIVAGQNAYKSKFPIPSRPNGTGFKLRIKHINSGQISDESAPIAIYYYSNTVTRRLDDKNGIDGKTNVILCANSTSTLQLKNKTASYRWYKDGNLIPNESSYKLTVSEAGKYHTILAIGTCNPDPSNTVFVSVVSGSSINIGSVSDIEICSSDKHTFTASVQDTSVYNYSWYKDDVLISGSINSFTYETTGDSSQFGKYKVRASANSNGTCELLSSEINIKQKAGGFTVALEVPNKMFLISGSQADLKISYTGTATVQWYFKSPTAISFTPISSATSDTYTAIEKGKYYAEATTTATAVSCSPTSKSGEIEVLSIDGISSIIELSDDYEACTSNATKIRVKNKITSGTGEYDMPTSIEATMVYEWSKKSNGGAYESISQTTKEVDLNSNTDNGTYRIKASLAALFGVSNALEVKLLGEDFKIESSAPLNSLSEGQSIELKVSPVVSGVTYKWSKEGSDISIDEKINVDTVGKYKVLINASGCERTLEVEVELTDDTKIDIDIDVDVKDVQNIISPFNRDQINDFWMLPKELMGESVRVIIYNTQGEELLNTTAYQNNWPPSEVEIGSQMILYYKIINKEKLVKAGTLSIIK